MGIEFQKDKHSIDFTIMKKGGESGILLTGTKASGLCRAEGVDLSHTGGGYREIDTFQQYLKEYCIIIYTSRNGKNTMYEGPPDVNRIKNHLYYENGNFDLIINAASAFRVNYYCELCKLGYNDARNHTGCPNICPGCHNAPTCASGGVHSIKCHECNRDFRGQNCFDNHKKEGLCAKLHRCQTCLHSVWLSKKDKHLCHHTYCRICRKVQPNNHQCYIQRATLSDVRAQKLRDKFLFIFYDLEAMQDKNLFDGSKMHVVNLGVTQQCCVSCITNDDVKEECAVCGVRQNVFTNDPVKEILDLIYEKQESFNVTVIAHNGKGYDFISMLREIMKENVRWGPEIIRTGTKIMSIKCGPKVRFVDSLNFMPMALSKFPSTFNFEGSKGYFPHFFNTTENANYFGPLPPRETYGCDDMGAKERDVYLSWYNDQVINNVQFDMCIKLRKYCIRDVTILRRGCVIFRELFLQNNGVDPFQESVTLASSCNLIFRRKFLRDNSIGIIPSGGYRLNDKQSLIALKWLYWVEHDRKIKIQHSGNGREVRLQGNLRVDGFCEATNTVFEFHGCYFHGCIRCHPV